MQQGAAFARRKRRKAAGGEAKGASPGPPLSSWEMVARLQSGAAPVRVVLSRVFSRFIRKVYHSIFE